MDVIIWLEYLCYRSHINNPGPMIYDCSRERPRLSFEDLFFLGIEPMSGNRRKRLERVEKKVSDLIKAKALANCNCQKFMFVRSKEKLETEMNKTCPAHGFRRLGRLNTVEIVPTEGGVHGGQIDEESQGLQELIEEYHRRLAEVEQAEEEQEYGWREN